MSVRLEVHIHGAPASAGDRRSMAAVLLRTGIEWELVPRGLGEVVLSWGEAPSPPAAGKPWVVLPRHSVEQWRGRWRASVEALLRGAAKRRIASLRPWHQSPPAAGEPHTVAIDLPNVARALLEGWEEEESPQRDEHGRFDPEASLLVQRGLLERPVLDEYCRALGELLWGLARPALAPPAPPLVACLSLDIDSAGMFAGRAALRNGALVSRLYPAKVHHAAFDFLRTKLRLLPDPHLSVRVLGELLEGLDFPATFFVQERRAHRLDNYSIAKAPDLVAQLRAVMDNAFHEVGLHGSYSSPMRPEGFIARQWRGLGRALGGGLAPVFRGHYLQRPQRWADLRPPGASQVVDSTLGYGAHIGFRRGTAWPFRVAAGVVEAPPCVMDTTHRYFARRSPQQALAANEAVLARLGATGGLFVAIFHPNNMDPFLWPGWHEAFLDLALTVKSSGATPQSLARGAMGMHRGAREMASRLEEHTPR